MRCPYGTLLEDGVEFKVTGLDREGEVTITLSTPHVEASTFWPTGGVEDLIRCLEAHGSESGGHSYAKDGTREFEVLTSSSRVHGIDVSFGNWSCGSLDGWSFSIPYTLVPSVVTCLRGAARDNAEYRENYN